MGTSFLGRALISKPTFAFLVAHSFTSSSLARVPSVHPNLRFLIAVKEYYQRPAVTGVHYFSTRPTTSSLNDPSPNWSNHPPKDSILGDGYDFEHWLVVMKPPDENATRDDIIDSYIKTLAQVVGSEDEARKKIYSVQFRPLFCFGCLVSKELSYKIEELPKVGLVLPDCHLNLRTKDYGGELFIDGKAVPYDPKYHEECGVQNNPTYPNQGPGGAQANPGYLNQGVGVAPPVNPRYQIQGVGAVPPANPGYQNQAEGGAPPVNPGYQNQVVGGAPPVDPGYISGWEELPPLDVILLPPLDVRIREWEELPLLDVDVSEWEELPPLDVRIKEWEKFNELTRIVKIEGWEPIPEFRKGEELPQIEVQQQDPSDMGRDIPNWSDRLPKETILDDGRDFEHWLVVMEPPDENATRDDIIDSYIKTLAQVVGSEDEARKKIYSVSSRCYFAFGCLVSEELSYKIQELPKVSWVIPDAYLDTKNKVYAGEPFIDGKAVPYDPKYHNINTASSHPVVNNALTSPHPGTGSTCTAPYQNQGSVPTGGMPNPGYQNLGGVPNCDFQSQGQGGMPSGGYRNQNRVAMPNSGIQNRGYQSSGMGGVQNNPIYPDQGPGGASTNPGYQNQGVGGAPPANPGYQIQGVGGVLPANPGYQNQAVGGAPPVNPRYQIRVVVGGPPVDHGYDPDCVDRFDLEVDSRVDEIHVFDEQTQSTRLWGWEMISRVATSECRVLVPAEEEQQDSSYTGRDIPGRDD